MSEKPTVTMFGRISEIVLDMAGIGGAGLIIWGVELIYRPAAFIVAGALVLIGAWLIARKGI